MTAEPVKNCPECNGKVKRLIGAGAGPIFKGSGFYQTDYKNNSQKSQGSKSNSTPAGPSKSTDTGKSGTGSESKP